MKRKKNSNSSWAIFKLFFHLTVNDLAGLIIVAILPILVSLIWIIIIHEAEIQAYPDTFFANDPVTFLWYPFTLFTTAFISFFYVSIKFNSFKNTIIFKKILIGGINKLNIVLMLFLFYFLCAFILVGTKVIMLSYYERFRNEIVNADIVALLSGFSLFIITNICLGITFANVTQKTLVIAIGGLFLMIAMLFLQGMFFDLEKFLFIVQKKKDGSEDIIVNEWMTISKEAKTLRYIRFLNPYQPAFNIIRQAHINENWVIPLKLGIQEKELAIKSTVEFNRPMVYNGYLLPVLVNSFWIFLSGGISYYFLKK